MQTTFTPMAENQDLSKEEWDLVNHLRREIKFNPAAISSADQEEFSTLFVRSLRGKGDPPIRQ